MLDVNDILRVEGRVNSNVSVAKCYVTDTYSIGLNNDNKVEMKYISKELYEMLIKELLNQKGVIG